MGGCLSLLESRARANLPLPRRGRSQEYCPSSSFPGEGDPRSTAHPPSSLFFNDSMGMGGGKDLPREMGFYFTSGTKEPLRTKLLKISMSIFKRQSLQWNASSVLLEKWRWSGKWSFTPKIVLSSTLNIPSVIFVYLYHWCLFTHISLIDILALWRGQASMFCLMYKCQEFRKEPVT